MNLSEDNNLSPRPQADPGLTSDPSALPVNPPTYQTPMRDIYPTPSESHGGEAPSPPKKSKNGWRSILATVLLFLAAPAIALTIAAFVIQSYQVEGQSMETTLQDKDRLIVNKLPRTWARVTKHSYIPKRGDIIIFNHSGLADSSTGEAKQLIKRVIALPGERVVIKDGNVTVYNQEHLDGFNPDKSTNYSITSKETSGEADLSVAEGQVFVLGDNRQNSEDSRFFGPVKADNVVGQLVLRLFPIGKINRF